MKIKHILQKEATAKPEFLSPEQEEFVLKALEESDKDIKAGRTHSQAEVEKH